MMMFELWLWLEEEDILHCNMLYHLYKLCIGAGIGCLKLLACTPVDNQGGALLNLETVLDYSKIYHL